MRRKAINGTSNAERRGSIIEGGGTRSESHVYSHVSSQTVGNDQGGT